MVSQVMIGNEAERNSIPNETDVSFFDHLISLLDNLIPIIPRPILKVSLPPS